MSATPQFTTVPRTEVIQLTAANALLDGSGSLGSGSFVAGASGSRVETISIKALGTTTAGMVRLFVSKGAATTLLTEVEIPAQTRTPSAKGFEAVLEAKLVLAPGVTLRASTEKAEPMNVTLFGGDF